MSNSEPQPRAERVTVSPAGQVDLATATEFAATLAQALREGPTQVVVDLTAVDFLDSVGVAVLVRAARAASDYGIQLYLHGARGAVERVLEITGVAAYIPPPPPA